MTVRELQDELANYPPDALVVEREVFKSTVGHYVPYCGSRYEVGTLVRLGHYRVETNPDDSDDELELIII